MLKPRIIIVLIAVFISSCEFIPGKKDNSDEKKTETGKTDIQVQKRYYDDGTIKSELPVKNKKRHGVAKKYYLTGKLNTSITYFNNVKHGESIWYYKSGKPYRVTSYYNGKRHGLQKKYYENGKLMSEVTYLKNFPQPGLKEYSKDGKLKTKYPKIRFNEIDKTAFENKHILQFSMSDKTKKVKFFSRIISEEKDTTYVELPSKSGLGKLESYVPPGNFIMKKLTIYAEVTTKLRNPYITKATYNLSVENRQ